MWINVQRVRRVQIEQRIYNMGLRSPLGHEQTDKGSRATLYGAVARRTGSGTGFGPTIMIASIS
jgi:hypothetical protein